MRRAAAIAAAVLAIGPAGCVKQPRVLGPFVRSAELVNGELVLQRCTIEVTTEEVSIGTCTTERRALCGGPTAAVPPEQLDRRAIDDAISPAIREAVAACARRDGVAAGSLAVRLRINYAGRLLAADPDRSGRELAVCVGNALSAAAFPRALNTTELEVAFAVGPTP